MENKTGLNIGDKFLSCKMSTAAALTLVLEAISKGEKNISFAAFKNKDRKTESQPNYKSGQVAVWISTKKPDTNMAQIDSDVEEIMM